MTFLRPIMFFKTITVAAFVAAATTSPASAASGGKRHQGRHQNHYQQHARQLAKDVPQYVRRQLFLNTNSNGKKVQWGGDSNNGIWTGDFDGDGNTDFGICPIVEGAINLGNEFGIEGRPIFFFSSFASIVLVVIVVFVVAAAAVVFAVHCF